MKKMLFAFLLILPFTGWSYIEDQFSFYDNCDENLYRVLYFCKSQILKYEVLMEETKSTPLYIIYLSKRDAYQEMLKYITES